MHDHLLWAFVRLTNKILKSAVTENLRDKRSIKCAPEEHYPCRGTRRSAMLRDDMNADDQNEHIDLCLPV